MRAVTKPIKKKTAKPRTIGRPSKYSKALADRLCGELAMGKSLRTVCESDKMPSVVTVFAWLRKNDEFLKQYARAKEESADAMADEVLDISDDGHNDWMLRRYGQDEVYVENGEAINRSRLRVETRKWLMAKMKPKRYGDKIDVTSAGERVAIAPVVVSDISPRPSDDAPAQGKTS